jgi:hypothetical protein
MFSNEQRNKALYCGTICTVDEKDFFFNKTVYAKNKIRYSNCQSTVVMLLANHRWCKARRCSNRTTWKAALPVVRRSVE